MCFSLLVYHGAILLFLFLKSFEVSPHQQIIGSQSRFLEYENQKSVNVKMI